MLCHSYAKDIILVERSIEHTFRLLAQFNKLEDCEVLVDKSIEMLVNLRDQPSSGGQASIDTKKSVDGQQNNL
jgi:hypothetical protein